MSLLHALAARKAKLSSSSTEYKMPNITCYEQAPVPGGVWRDISEEERKTKDENKAVM